LLTRIGLDGYFHITTMLINFRMLPIAPLHAIGFFWRPRPRAKVHVCWRAKARRRDAVSPAISDVRPVNYLVCKVAMVDGKDRGLG